MAIYMYKCACKECGRTIEIDTCNNIITVSDFLLDEVHEVNADKVIFDALVPRGIMMHVENLDFIISNKAKEHFVELLNSMKGESHKIKIQQVILRTQNQNKTN